MLLFWSNFDHWAIASKNKALAIIIQTIFFFYRTLNMYLRMIRVKMAGLVKNVLALQHGRIIRNETCCNEKDKNKQNAQNQNATSMNSEIFIIVNKLYIR